MDNKFTVAVVVEHDLNGIKTVTNEILQVASGLGGTVIAYCFSDSREMDAQQLIDNGANDVKLCIHPDLSKYIHETYAAGLLSEIKKSQPDIVLLHHPTMVRSYLLRWLHGFKWDWRPIV